VVRSRRPGMHPPRLRSVQRLMACNGELATDARVAILRFAQSGTPSSLALIGASEAMWTGAGAFRLPPLRQAEDLYLDQSLLRQFSAATDA
jgi:hypothetical protein